MARFRDLEEGQSFDFVGPERMLNSFYLRCKKVSARRYVDEKGYVHRVGSVYCEVYNIDDESAYHD